MSALKNVAGDKAVNFDRNTYLHWDCNLTKKKAIQLWALGLLHYPFKSRGEVIGNRCLHLRAHMAFNPSSRQKCFPLQCCRANPPTSTVSDITCAICKGLGDQAKITACINFLTCWTSCFKGFNRIECIRCNLFGIHKVKILKMFALC
jgi:hypothetical protein